MNKENIISILINREGYDPERAKLVAAECMNMSPELMTLFNDWLDNRGDHFDYEAQGYKLSDMIRTRGLKYPAALLDMDWLIKEPEKAKPVIDSLMKAAKG